MKKVYLSLLAMGLVASAGHAQVSTKHISERVVNKSKINTAAPSIKPSANTSSAAKALGVVIWEDVFDSGANWTIDNDGQSGNVGWTIDAVNSGWWATGAVNYFTSGGGFAELYNNAPSDAVEDVTYTMTGPVWDIPNLAGNTANTDQVTLQYEQFGALFLDEQAVQLSTDGGTTWTTIRDNRDFHDITNTVSNNAYPQPELVSINLGPYLSGNASTVQIRFSWTSAFPSSTNAQRWVTYGWYLDDVRIITNADNDIRAFDESWQIEGLDYSRIPSTQVQPIDFSITAVNQGLNTQTDVTFNVDVAEGANSWSGSSTPQNIAVGDTGFLVTTTEYTPVATAGTTHTISWDVTQAETDDIPANAEPAGDSFQVTEHVYAVDDDAVEASFGNQGFGWEAGSYFDIWNDQTAYAIQIKLHNSSEAGSNVYGKIYSLDENAQSFADALVFEQQTIFHEVTAQDLAQGVITIPLAAPLMLTAAKNTYFVAAVTDGDGGQTDDVQLATSGKSRPQTSFIFFADDNNWFWTDDTPVVRLNFDPANNVGLEELSNIAAVQVFPNPASNEVNLSFNVTGASDVKVQVLDMTGKVMETVVDASNVSGVQKSTLNTSSYASGMYMVTITTNEGSIQRNFVKK